MSHYNLTVSKYYGRNVTPGEVGIEIEVEGRQLPEQLQYYWDIHQDGSLRAPTNGQALEYVLRRPINRGDVRKVLQYLDKALKPSELLLSPRCSVHVHVNQGHRTFQDIYKLIVAYAIVEDMMVAFCGEQRVGNMFCLRLRDAEYLADQLVLAIKNEQFKNLGAGDELRYSALNVAALRKFGSIEFRAMRPTVDPEVIQLWVDILMSLSDNAVSQFSDPQDVITRFSSDGPERFLRTVFPNHYQHLLAGDWRSSMFYGMRIAQDIAYAIPRWEKATSPPIKPRVADSPDNMGEAAAVDFEIDVDDVDEPHPIPAAGLNAAAQWGNAMFNEPPVGVGPGPIGGAVAARAAPHPAAAHHPDPRRPARLVRPPLASTETLRTMRARGMRRTVDYIGWTVRTVDGFTSIEPAWENIPHGTNRVICNNRIWTRP